MNKKLKLTFILVICFFMTACMPAHQMYHRYAVAPFNEPQGLSEIAIALIGDNPIGSPAFEVRKGINGDQHVGLESGNKFDIEILTRKDIKNVENIEYFFGAKIKYGYDLGNDFFVYEVDWSNAKSQDVTHLVEFMKNQWTRISTQKSYPVIGTPLTLNEANIQKINYFLINNYCLTGIGCTTTVVPLKTLN